MFYRTIIYEGLVAKLQQPHGSIFKVKQRLPRSDNQRVEVWQKSDNQSYQTVSCYPLTGLWRSDRQSLHGKILVFSCIQLNWKPTPIQLGKG